MDNITSRTLWYLHGGTMNAFWNDKHRTWYSYICEECIQKTLAEELDLLILIPPEINDQHSRVCRYINSGSRVLCAEYATHFIKFKEISPLQYLKDQNGR